MSISEDSLVKLIGEALDLKDPELAKDALQKIDLQLNSSVEEEERIYLLFSRANCYVALQDFVQARKALDVALSARPDESAKTNFDWMHGVIAQNEARYAEALERFTVLLANHSRQLESLDWHFLYEDIQTRRGFLCVTLEKFGEAIPLLQESLSFESSKNLRGELSASLGLCHLELKQYQLATQSFLNAMSSGLVDEWEWKVPFYLGIAYFYTDMCEEAKHEFHKCEQLAEKHPLPTLDIYAWLSATCKRLEQDAESEHYARLKKRN